MRGEVVDEFIRTLQEVRIRWCTESEALAFPRFWIYLTWRGMRREEVVAIGDRSLALFKPSLTIRQEERRKV